jgi:uncharacterized RDD family membrane protein YckC
MNYASPVSRLIALAIDWVVLLIIGAIVGLVLGNEIGGLVAFIIGVTYQWFFLTQQNGQTPGKKLMGIRVVKADGGALGPIDPILRYIGYFINSFLLMIGWLWALIDSKRQGFHDKLAGTVVVKA